MHVCTTCANAELCTYAHVQTLHQRREAPRRMHASCCCYELCTARYSLHVQHPSAHTSAWHKSAYISMRQHTSAYVSIVSIRQHASEYVSICHLLVHDAGVSIHLASTRMRQHPPAYISIRQHTSAYASIRQHR